MNEKINQIKSMIESNQPYYTIFDVFIQFCLDEKIFMKNYEMHRAVCIHIKPYASIELLNYFEKNINNL
jgi:hypothetical protein